jgi:iron complex outermembrane receptor protein
MKRDTLAVALATALLASMSNAASAQNTDASTAQNSQAQTNTPANKEQLQTVTVTGSAIPRTDLETPSPVTVISSADIQRSGFSTVSDLVHSLSADNSGSLPSAFSGALAVGASGVALRGLTVDSTVVLVDGLRNAIYAAADDGERSFVDLNTLPLVAVDHIEVLKDSASSLYGADAIGGVINIILKRDFQGLEATADIGDSERGGGFSKKATLLGGTGDLQKDGHNFYFGVQYETDTPIWASDRPYPFNSSDLSPSGGTNPNVPGSNVGSVYGSVQPGTIYGGSLLNGVPTGGLLQTLRPCGPGSTTVTNDPNNPGTYCSQNIAGQYGQDQPESKQLGLYGRGTFQINDTTRAYVSASLFQYQSWAYQPSLPQVQNGNPVNTDYLALPPVLANGQLNPNDPYASQGQYALINYAFPVPQLQYTDNRNARIVGDLNGTLGDWNYDLALVLNHTDLTTNAQGYLSYHALIDAVTNGTYNFVNPSANSAAVMQALFPGYSTKSTSDLDSIDFSVNRSLWDMAGGTSTLALGTQFRYEAQDYPEINPDDEFLNRNVVQAAGHRTVAGAWFEFDAPLLSSLEADLSGRFDHYSDFGNNFSPKLGLKWKPTDAFALRGTYSRGFRAPSFAEMGNALSYGGTPYSMPDDYIAAHNNDDYVQRPGVGELSVGNSNLKPEKSTSATFGTVVQPTDWLNASVDYYQIKKTQNISDPNWGLALSNYFAGLPLPNGMTIIAAGPDPNYPNLLPKPLEIVGPYVNANWMKTKGIDIDLQTHFEFASGMQWVSKLSVTDVFSWKQSYGPGQVYQFVGLQAPYVLSAGTGTPRWRASWSNTLLQGPWTTTVTARYTSGMTMVAQDVGVFPGTGSCLSTDPNGNPFPASCWAPSSTMVDLTGSYQVNDRVTITASIFDLFNRMPPFDPADYAGLNYNPGFYQEAIVGRFFNIGIKLKL